MDEFTQYKQKRDAESTEERIARQIRKDFDLYFDDFLEYKKFNTEYEIND